MKTVSAALAAHLDGDATTLCHCWRVTRRDGVVLGFTEHDRDIAFEGTVFSAASGFQAAEGEAGNGLSVDASEVTGGFSSAAIDAGDVRAGRYDGARVEMFLVNWQAPEERLLLRVQEIGEVTAAGGAFRAELRRLTHRLEQVTGRLYGRRCDAMLGDARCKVDMGRAGLSGTGAITGIVSATQIRVSGLSAAASGTFRAGTIAIASGVNAGYRCDIDEHKRAGTSVVLSLWLPPPLPLAVGDRFSVTAGCDKSFATCGARFDNMLNFQGFPHMPGPDFAYGYADGDSVHDGRRLYD